jgi:hypothetical protein
MKQVDWLLISGALSGAFVGAVSLSYFAMQLFHLYTPVFETTTGTQVVKEIERIYNLDEMALWAVVGAIVGAFLGALAVSKVPANLGTVFVVPVVVTIALVVVGIGLYTQLKPDAPSAIYAPSAYDEDWLKSILEPRQPPIPFSCADPSGAAVTEVSYTDSRSGTEVTVNGRITNTCNKRIRVDMTAVVYGPDDAILSSAEAQGATLFVGPGESRVVKIEVSVPGRQNIRRAAIETRYYEAR